MPKRSGLAQRRRFVGLTQEALAEKLRVDRTTVVRWERGSCEPQPWMRPPLAAALAVSLEVLGALLAPDVPRSGLDSVPPVAVTVAEGSDDGGDPTDRRTFGKAAVLTGFGLGGVVDQVLALDSPVRLGAEHLSHVSSVIDRFEQGDAAVGGAGYCDIGIALHRRLLGWERQTSCAAAVRASLRENLGELECWIGWLALDAERRDTSYRYLHEAIVRARLHDDPRLEVRAMACLSLLIREGRPQESLQCAEAAMRISAAWASPRLTALLHLRAAHALGVVRDAGGFGRHMAMAMTHLERESADDPVYLAFVTPMELTGIEGLGLLCLDQPEKAVRAFRSITEHPAAGYRRNHGYYSVHLAEAYRRSGDIPQAAAVALAAVPGVNSLRSPRTHRSFATLRARLGDHVAGSTAVRDFAAAYDAAVRNGR